MSQQLLDRCLEAAVARGVDVSATYEPWLPVDMMQTLFLHAHDTLGCSWLSALMIACIGIRTVTLPISISAIRASREKAMVQPEFMRLTERQQQLTVDGDQEKLADNSKKLQAFQQKHGKFFMLKGTGNLILFQMPLYVTAFAAIRGMAGHPDLYRSFAMESPLWLDSLALADPYGLFPLMTAAIMITNTELFGSIDTEVSQVQQAPTALTEAVGGQGTFQKYQKWIMRGAALMFVPMTCNFPAGVFIFMSTNLVLSTTQNRLLRLPVLERLLEIPPPPERSAAAAAAARAGPPALLPLGRTLRDAQKASPSLSIQPSSSLATASAASHSQKGPVMLAAQAHADARAGAKQPVQIVGQFQSSPRFAVRRARPMRPELG